MRILISVGVVVGLVMGAVSAAIMYVTHSVEQPLAVNEPQLYTVERGSSAYKVVKDLRQQSLTEISPFIAKVWLRLFASDTQIKSGTYALQKGMTLPSFMALLSSGDEHHFAVSLVEGLTLNQWQDTLRADNEYLVFDLDADRISKIVKNSPWAEHHEQPEGLFLADTYFYTANTKASVILARALQAMHEFINEQWQDRQEDLPFDSPYEALILASIIEKETAVPAERSQIAGVFVNRLRKNMRLQTDPTVIYGIGESFDGNITRKHLRTATPYNTYVIKGLPPTPIAMAGKDAIMAALHPQATDALYFVARGDGSHEFSTSLEAHNKAVRKYQLN